MTPKILGRAMIYGDIHLSSKNYGAHRNYPKESLSYFEAITNKAEELEVTHLIGTGDFTYGRFHTLEYRAAVEKQLERQYVITDGNRYEIKGNHDSATYGMTEYEYYIKKGLLKPSCNIQIGMLNISMVDFAKHMSTKILPVSEETISVIVAHDYFKFNNTQLPDYGKSLILDDMRQWYGVDYLVCGHIHNFEQFEGLVVDNNTGYNMVVTYLGCMSRPAYREGFMQDVGKAALFTVYDNNTVEVDFVDIPLWSLEESFNLEQKQKEKEKDEYKHVDVSDIVKQLDSHERVVGNPEDIIMAMENIDIRYRNKAIDLLMSAQG